MPELTHEQRARLSHNLQRIAKLIEGELQRATGRKDVGFSLIIWGAFGADRMTQYVANVEREDAMRHMLELIEGWRGGMPDLPYHERQ